MHRSHAIVKIQVLSSHTDQQFIKKTDRCHVAPNKIIKRMRELPTVALSKIELANDNDYPVRKTSCAR